MKILLFTLFFALIGTLGFAQSWQEIDSLKHELAIVKQDTNRVLILVELAANYQNTNPDTALKYGQQALNLAQKIKFLRGQARAFHRLGSINRVIGELPKALSLIYNGLQIAEENHFYFESAWCLNLLGVLFRDLNDDTKAVNYLQQALKSNHLAANSKEKVSQTIQFLANIGNVYRQRNLLDSATYYLRKAENLGRKNNESIPSPVLSMIGQIEFLLRHPQKAINYSHKAIQLCKQNNDHRTAGTVYHTLATYFKKLNQPDSAIYYSKIGLAESQSIDFKDGILLNSRLLTELYESRDIRKAYEYQKIATTTNEEIYGAKKVQALQKTIFDEIDRQRQLEVERINYQTELRQYAFLAGLGVLLLIAFILYRNNQKEKRAKDQLQEKNKVIEKTLSTLQSTQAQLIQKEKLASLGELTAGIAHEIQNPLNFVNNFSEVSAELVEEMQEELNRGDTDEAKAIAEDIKLNLGKINHHGKRASSIVKGMLEHSRTSTGERQLTDINQLADEYLRLSFHGMKAKNNQFNCDYELIGDENLPTISAVPQEIGRVLLNLMNNAFYAVNERTKQGEPNYQPKVTVSTKLVVLPLGVRGLAVIVSDNGTGIPEATKSKIFQPFFTTKPTGEGTGLGLSLAYDIVTKGHGGTLEVESVEGKGTTFIVKLPIQNS